MLSKGVRVVIKGTIEQKTWDDKETGEKRSTFVVSANAIGLGLISIQSFERRKGNAGQGELSVASSGVKTATRPANNPRPKLPTRTQTLEQEEPF